MLGHAMAGAGAGRAVAAVASLQHRSQPATPVFTTTIAPSGSADRMHARAAATAVCRSAS